MTDNKCSVAAPAKSGPGEVRTDVPTDNYSARNIKTFPNARGLSVRFTEEQYKQVMAFLRSHPWSSTRKISDATGIPLRDVADILLKMRADGKVEYMAEWLYSIAGDGDGQV